MVIANGSAITILCDISDFEAVCIESNCRPCFPSCFYASELSRSHIELSDPGGAYNAFFERYRAAVCVKPEFTVTVDSDCVNGVPFSQSGNSRFFLMHKAISDFLLSNYVLTFHASALCYEGKTYLFSAPSGTGKSTHTRLWRETFGEKVVMICDDQPFIGFDETGRAICYGSPYNGKEKLGANIEAPIGGICVCRRAEDNSLHRLSAAEAVLRLSPNAYIPEEADLAAKALTLIKRLAETVPAYDHAFNMDPSAAEYAMKHLIEKD